MRPPIQPVAPSIGDPIELLLACHDKVRRFAGLTLRLRDHLAAKGPDKSAQEAAQSILRHFTLAAPLHHDDEELDLFPALRQLAVGALDQEMGQLEAEHAELAALWQSLQAWLQAPVAGQPHAAPDTLTAFAQRYPAHAQREEALVYPYATRLTPEQISQITSAMVARRTAP
ncbi:MAG: hemerythrin domain-containing protein [Aquabacterium sp.]|nr:hemerythrin domain-containing protein [Aquabacterium sp.]